MSEPKSEPLVLPVLNCGSVILRPKGENMNIVEIAKGIIGLLGIIAFCAAMYCGLGAVCVVQHGVAACAMEESDQ
jgi:hypothetical protein